MVHKILSRISESLPNITGGFGGLYGEFSSGHYTGAFYASSNSCKAGLGTNWYLCGPGFSASRSSSTYQDGAPVYPNSVSTLFYIKY